MADKAEILTVCYDISEGRPSGLNIFSILLDYKTAISSEASSLSSCKSNEIIDEFKVKHTLSFG